MSSSATTPASVGVAPWRPLFLSHLAKMDSPEFVFTSLSPVESKESPTPCVPRARYCIYRGMWGELPENKHNDAPQNERVFASDLPTLTTDVRMHKVPEIFASSQGHGGVSKSQGSGGGGPVEAVFWVKEAMTQWRIRGDAYIVGPDIEGPDEGSSGARAVKSRIGERMRVVQEEGRESWSWSKELTAHFGNLSPGMRGSFKNPAPGTPVSIPPSDPSLCLGQKVSDLEDEVARKHFRLVIIRPGEVEQVDLTDPDNARRWIYSFVGPKGGNPDQHGSDVGEWRVEELWP
ncbi:pyridoxamine 5'-phosphate oxidase-domain-containing protein [Amylocarpus encephaloides]|uniref:Pyridoxamine 5'-phosphate oxidase-domain-containing protein n=1 Tax=Amylocarpus encephaloides TaxID=45428 RepID=A0A9P7YG10_9HELO|nr:pyridoxamine 5'-phosphate oxidase-domain-containing protein [Amylocarpus encephaloides]